MLELIDTQIPLGEIAVRMGLATVAGMVLGIDREVLSKPAGLRTHMLISLAAAVFTLLTFELSLAAAALEDSLRPDPVRVTEAVITGVAFLGAGTIIQSKHRVQGITTGTSIWLAGAIGIACGGGYYAIAALALFISIIVLTVVGIIEHRFRARTPDGQRHD